MEQLSLFDYIEQQKASNEVKPKIKEKEKQIIPETTIKILSSKQLIVLEKWKKEIKVSRIIHHVSGRMLVELENNKYMCFDKDGKEIFVVENKAPILPKDKMIYFNPELLDDELNQEQLSLLEEVKRDWKAKRIIHRKADNNILIEHENGVISITPRGWKVEYENIKKIDCTEEEVIENLNEEVVIENLDEEVKEINSDKIEVGDNVEVNMEEGIIKAKVSRIYNDGDTYNIKFDKKHTAIHKSSIIKKIA